MIDKIGFIGVGQGGGNIAHLLEQKGFKSLYINTSLGDLNTINTGSENKYHIKDGIGCAKERKIAKNAIKYDFGNILTFIKEKMQRDYIYMVFSSGGGTGSGSSPLLTEILSREFPNKKIGAISILPNENDTLQAHINAYECMCELSNIENIGSIFVLDNNKNKDILSINEKFVNLFSKIFDYKKNETKKGNIDEAEILKLLGSKGMINIATCKNSEKTKDLLNNINNGIFAPIEKDGKIKYLGLSKSINFDYEMFKKEIGIYIDKFENVNQNYTMAILSGLTLPFKRVLAMKEKIKKEQEVIKRNLYEESKNPLEKIDFLENMNKPKTEKKEEQFLNEDIIAKYMR